MLFVDKSKVQEPFSRVRLHAEPSSSCFDLMKVHHLKHEWKCHELQNNPLHSDLEICGRSWLGYAALGLAQLMEFTRTADATQQLKGEELSERIGKNDALLPKAVENKRSPCREIVICCQHVPNKQNEPPEPKALSLLACVIHPMALAHPAVNGASHGISNAARTCQMQLGHSIKLCFHFQPV